MGRRFQSLFAADSIFDHFRECQNVVVNEVPFVLENNIFVLNRFFNKIISKNSKDTD